MINWYSIIGSMGEYLADVVLFPANYASVK